MKKLILFCFLMNSFICFCQTTIRARDLGVPFDWQTGQYNAITDVPGVEVGMVTLEYGNGKLQVGKGPVRTGVTAILPRGKKFDPVFAAWHTLNGNGDMTGTHWVKESGFLETPILITNTNSVGVVRDACLEWQRDKKYFAPLWGDIWFAYPLVAETYDGALNDITGFHVKKEHVFKALENARSGTVPEGNVGGGTGMICLGFKGGTGTASAKLAKEGGGYTVGVLVQSNFGSRADLLVAGVPVGKELLDTLPMFFAGNQLYGPSGNRDKKEQGSIIVIVATDAPLLPHQLQRLVQRVSIGIGRVGGFGGNSSGDIFLAFSTANPGVFKREGQQQTIMISNDQLDPLFHMTAYATEEAIINALVAARSMKGINDNFVPALPHQSLKEILKKYNRLKEKR